MRVSELVVGAAMGAGLISLFNSRAVRRRLPSDDLSADARTSAASKIADARQTAVGLSDDLVPIGNADIVSGDASLRDEVYAALKQQIAYARSLRVDVSDGRATLHGPVLAHDLLPVLNAARAVRGITSVDSHLDVHYTPANSPEFVGPDTGVPSRF